MAVKYHGIRNGKYVFQKDEMYIALTMEQLIELLKQLRTVWINELNETLPITDQVEPLIYTSKGNLPLIDLEYRHAWTDNDIETRFVQEWRLGDEVVKRSEHAFLKHGLRVETKVAKLR